MGRSDLHRIPLTFRRCSEREVIQAELFFEELTGQRLFDLGNTTEDDVDPSIALARRGTFRHAPLGNRGHNVEARWNFDAATGRRAPRIDIVVHLHGYGYKTSDFLARKVQLAGLDMVDSSGAITVRSTRPTLALVPLGTHNGGRTWTFPHLATVREFNALVDVALQWLGSSVLGLPSGTNLARERLILMAHSGGGAGMNNLLHNGLDPDEVVCYDSTYGAADPIIKWAKKKIAGTGAAASALRVFYLPCSPNSWTRRDDGTSRLSSTEIAARRIKHAIDAALQQSTAATSLASRYRVDRTTERHNDIPKAYTSILLNDIAATVTSMKTPPPSSVRPACARNRDWLTRPPQRP